MHTNDSLTPTATLEKSIAHTSSAETDIASVVRGDICRHSNLVWHYAPWSYLHRIVKSGALLGSNAGAPEEKPMLWFSANQHWEPTATKLMKNGSGGILQLTFAQQVKHAGCIRFGLAAEDPRLFNWKEACVIAGTKREMRRALEMAGKRQGANPAHWYATPAAVPLSELVFQVWDGKWQDATSPQDMATVWEDAQQRQAANDSAIAGHRRIN